MSFIRTEAIVIKAINLREADKIITFFSRDYGKIQGVARGIRKITTKYSGKLELFTRVNVIFFQKHTHPLLRITQVDVVEVFPQLKSDFNKIVGASYIAEFLNKIFEEYDSTHKPVYVLVCNTFRTLAGCENLRNIIPAFEIKLLAHLGYTPILDHCTVCGRSGSTSSRSSDGEFLGFSSSSGGILCQRCKALKKDSITITPQAVDILQQFLNTKMPHIPAIAMPKERYPEIKNLLMHHIQYHIGISLKTEQFVQKLRSANL